MIYRNSLRAASKARIPLPSQPHRSITSSSANAATQTSSSTPPAATSTSAARSFSEFSQSGARATASDAAKKKPAPLVKSSIVAGTPLKGLNFEKNKTDPVALADDEYPAWLWTILGRQEKTGEKDAMGDLFSKSKKQRRVAAKRLRKEHALNPDLLVPKIPLFEQTVDLPVAQGSLEGAVEARGAREELTKVMRGKRRADIKEKNFLKAMR
ncbi:mitochondrial ribosomal protein L37-domain-containing protein [Ampelomyces quisqualis]|uniref:Large ribosomal subunit protein mL54 n=1 Tax=Ampelomyces quisqualis TaxID=50730 RepID=A0A6A5QCA7_AMPQU|nr:mitochondrial ribosomal protein L37-domain-containing protein [Ampelomyces quisqualis]